MMCGWLLEGGMVEVVVEDIFLDWDGWRRWTPALRVALEICALTRLRCTSKLGRTILIQDPDHQLQKYNNAKK
jgi:hypothetical protein